MLCIDIFVNNIVKELLAIQFNDVLVDNFTHAEINYMISFFMHRLICFLSILIFDFTVSVALICIVPIFIKLCAK